MPLITKIAFLGFALGFFSLICLVILGQTTVRKLRNNPEAKSELGLEVMSGFDIVNVASALSCPDWLAKITEKRPHFGANKRTLVQHTNRFDQVLACITWYSLLISASILITCAYLDDSV